MSRASPSSSRQLSLTEELEKLEQSITLTLQEIDHNFSRAHRIVTSSILPIVEQYADHSKAVWEGSKVRLSKILGRAKLKSEQFWKQFFEASANVSLSGVEERDDDDEEEFSYTQSQGNASTYAESTSQRGDNIHADEIGHKIYDEPDDSLLDDADISGSTPRTQRPRSVTDIEPRFADYPSPYEALKQELKGAEGQDENQGLPVTPGGQSRLPDMSMTPGSSPFDPMTHAHSSRKAAADPLLHRVLDKNYRVHATPHTLRKDMNTPKTKPSWRDTESPMSSPPVAAPQLHADIFSSPIRQQYNKPPAPQTPEVTTQTPPKRKNLETTARLVVKDEITWESDSDEDADGVYRELGLSPPKTIQFSMPQSRLLQTPAREASKKIVEDLLTTAGAGFDDSDALDDSPSIVATRGGLDDSF